MQILITVLAALALVLAGLIIYDSNRFCVVDYEIESPKIKKDFHFLFLSDLHNKQYGKDNEKLLAAIDKKCPEAILIGGDILTATPGKDVTAAARFVRTLAEKYPVYYANGNHEQRLGLYPDTYGEMGPLYEKLLSEIGIKRLVNAKAEDADHGIEVVGCEIDKRFYKRFERVVMPEDYLPQILPQKNGETYTILLAHNPDYFEQYVAWGADLVLGGHVHGGVVRIPYVGGVIATNFRLFPKYDGGLFCKGKQAMIVSRGLGAHTIPLRLFNPAELVSVVIKKER